MATSNQLETNLINAFAAYVDGKTNIAVYKHPVATMIDSDTFDRPCYFVDLVSIDQHEDFNFDGVYRVEMTITASVGFDEDLSQATLHGMTGNLRDWLMADDLISQLNLTSSKVFFVRLSKTQRETEGNYRNQTQFIELICTASS